MAVEKKKRKRVPATPHHALSEGRVDADLDGLGDQATGENAEKRNVPRKERMRLVSESKALPDGSYPIATVEDLHNAAHLAESGHGDVSAARELIARRARELGVKNPLTSEKKNWISRDGRNASGEHYAKTPHPSQLRHGNYNYEQASGSLADSHSNVVSNKYFSPFVRDLQAGGLDVTDPFTRMKSTGNPVSPGPDPHARDTGNPGIAYGHRDLNQSDASFNGYQSRVRGNPVTFTGQGGFHGEWAEIDMPPGADAGRPRVQHYDAAGNAGARGPLNVYDPGFQGSHALGRYGSAPIGTSNGTHDYSSPRESHHPQSVKSNHPLEIMKRAMRGEL